jgi:hypothetical protein
MSKLCLTVSLYLPSSGPWGRADNATDQRKEIGNSMVEVHAAPAKVENCLVRELQRRSANLFGGFGRNPCTGASPRA